MKIVQFLLLSYFILCCLNIQCTRSLYDSSLSWSSEFDIQGSSFVRHDRIPSRSSSLLIQNTDTYPNLSPIEFTALSNFYYSTNGPHWIYFLNETHWNFTDPNANPCIDQWTGVFCNCSSTFCTLQRLNLPLKNLTGQFPPSLVNFTSLESVGMARNYLYGTLPPFIGQLQSLKNITLRYNLFSGSLPKELYWLDQLKVLDLQDNYFNGTVSGAIGNLTNLQILDFNHNFFSGTLPSEIGQLTNLLTLRLVANEFHGALPESIYNLSSILTLFLSINKFSSTISNKIMNLQQMFIFDIALNEFTGTIPSELGKLEKIVAMAWSYNQLVGGLPSTLGGMKSLRAIDFATNLLSKSLPDFIGALDVIEVIYLDNNSFTGKLPETFAKMINLLEFVVATNLLSGNLSAGLLQSDSIVTFIATQNQFSSSLPSQLRIPRITSFQLQTNYFTGIFPESINTCEIMDYLDISSNYFNGNVPSSMGNLSCLMFFYGHTNLFTGSIPFSLEKLREISEFYLYDNQLTGTLDTLFPSSLITIQEENPAIHWNITSFDVSENSITGTLPTVLFNISTHMKDFVVSSNCFSGTIPIEICRSSRLKNLVMDGLSSATSCRLSIFPSFTFINSFILSKIVAGTIPSCLLTMPMIEELHLSGNGLTGSLPSDLTLPATLNNFAASHNFLTGTIPSIYQRKNWSSIDISYNRLTGKIYPYSFTLYNGGSVYLEENRISGDVPFSLVNIQNIFILQGNMFQCNAEKTNVPQNDPNLQVYDCASDSVNNSFYVYAAVIGFLLLIIIILELIRRKWSSTPASNGKDGIPSRNQSSSSPLKPTATTTKTTLSRMFYNVTTIYQQIYQRCYELFYHPIFTQNDDPNILSIIQFMQSIRKATGYITMMILLLLLPVYIGLSLNNSMYQFRYIWLFSSIFLTGLPPTVILFLCFGGFIIWVACIFYQYFVNIYLLDDIIEIEEEEKEKELRSTVSAKPGKKRISKRLKEAVNGRVISLSKDSNTFSVDRIFPPTTTKRRFRFWEYGSYLLNSIWTCIRNVFTPRTKGLLIIFCMNFIIMIIIDLCYVYVVIHYSSTIVVIAEVAMSIFRIFWNDVVIWNMILRLREILLNQEVNRIMQEKDPNDPLYRKYQKQFEQHRLQMRKSNFRVTIGGGVGAGPASIIGSSESLGSFAAAVKTQRSIITTAEMRFIPRTEYSKEEDYGTVFDPNDSPEKKKLQELLFAMNGSRKEGEQKGEKEEDSNAQRRSSATRRPSSLLRSVLPRASSIEPIPPRSSVKDRIPPQTSTDSVFSPPTLSNLQTIPRNDADMNEREGSLSSLETVNRTTVGYRYPSSEFIINDPTTNKTTTAVAKKKSTLHRNRMTSEEFTASFNLYDDHITLQDIFDAEKDVIFLIRIVLLNNIIIPCLAVAIISGRCFYYAIFAAPAVTSSYTYYECSVYTPIRIAEIEVCALIAEQSRSITYEPPFSYNYECTSVLLTKFASVFVYMALFAGILLPLGRMILAAIYHYCYFYYPEQFIHSKYDDWLLSMLPLPFIPMNVLVNVDSKVNKYFPNSKFVSPPPPLPPPPSATTSIFSKNNVIKEDEIKLEEGRASQFQGMDRESDGNPSNLSLSESEGATGQGVAGGKVKENMEFLEEAHLPLINGTLFNREKFIVKITNYIAILITFGVIFPLLALILCLSLWILTAYEQITITNFILNLRKVFIIQYSNEFILHSKYLNHSFQITLWLLLGFASLLYAALLFNVVGDQQGWKQGVIAVAIMIGWTILVFCCFERIWRMYQDYSKSRNSSEEQVEEGTERKDEQFKHRNEYPSFTNGNAQKDTEDINNSLPPPVTPVTPEENSRPSLLNRISARLSMRLSGLFTTTNGDPSMTATEQQNNSNNNNSSSRRQSAKKHIIDQIMDDEISVDIDEEEQAKMMGGIVRRSYLLKEDIPGEGRQSMLEMSPRPSQRSSIRESSLMLPSPPLRPSDSREGSFVAAASDDIENPMHHQDT